MAAPGDEPGRRVDGGEWILESDDHAIREGARGQPISVRSGPGFLSTALIIVLLAIIAAASVSAPMLARRPWVGPWTGHEQIVVGLIAGRAMKVRVMLRNSGGAPALDLRVAMRLLVGDPPPSASPQLAQCGEARIPLPQTVLFPDSTYSKTVAIDQEIDDDTVAAVLRGDKTVYLAGCAQYGDSLMRWLHLSPRHTHFCRMLVPTSAGNYGVFGNFEDCPAGNSAD